MFIRLNGKNQEVSDGLTLAQLLGTYTLTVKQVAVARNGEVIPAHQLAQEPVCPQDEIEIFHAVGGG